MGNRRNRRARWVIVVLILILAVLAIFVVFFPTGKKGAPPAGYAPLRDDVWAARYRPIFDCPAKFGPILAVYYRAARDDSGIIHIAYHPLWAREENDAPGIGAFLSRYLYTGGLSLQRLMFGPGDIEAIGLAVDPATGAIIQVDYETAANYDPSSFSVTHQTVSLKGSFDAPLRFKVVSWNHLFVLEEQGGAVAQTSKQQSSSAALPPLSYFTPSMWNHYGIWKNPQTILRKDRAHFVWERGAVDEGLRRY